MPFLPSTVSSFESGALDALKEAMFPRLVESQTKALSLTSAASTDTLGSYTEIDASLTTDVVFLHVVRYDQQALTCNLRFAYGAAASEVPAVGGYFNSVDGFDDFSTGNLAFWGLVAVVFPCRFKAGERLSAAVANNSSASAVAFTFRVTPLRLES